MNRNLFVIAFAAMMIGPIIVFGQSPAPNNVLYVNQQIPVAGDGSSWQLAMVSLADALVWAEQNRDRWSETEPLQIWVASGTYKPKYRFDNLSVDNTVFRSFRIVQNVQLYGGFSGSETTVSQRGELAANPTVLSGDLNGDGVPSEGDAAHVLLAVGLVGSACLDGFTITGGYAVPSASSGNNTIQVNGCHVDGSYGAGLYQCSASLNVKNCIFSNNRAFMGAGMFNSPSKGVNFSVENCYFLNNIVADHINFSEQGGGGGAGMFNLVASPRIVNSTFIGNRAIGAKQTGGAISDLVGGPLVVNCLFLENEAYEGAAVQNSSSLGEYVNCTFVGNRADEEEGGGTFTNRYGRPVIRNTIMYGNSSGIKNVSTGTEVSYSLVQGTGGSDSWNGSGGIDGGNNVDVDPLFLNSNTGDYSLSTTSPAVNRGDPTTDQTVFPLRNNERVDLVGNPRRYGPRVDLGAYELIDDTALPVKLSWFSGSYFENFVHLSWQTTEEVNASHFEIERSIGGADFTLLATVRTRSLAGKRESYRYEDVLEHRPFESKVAYYRLRMVDQDGTFSYSAIASVALPDNGKKPLTIYPNPASERVTVALASEEVKEASFELVDSAGRVFLRTENDTFSVVHLPEGLYFLRVEGSRKLIEKLLIRR